MKTYFNTKVLYEDVTFDSKFECEVYKTLRKYIPKENIDVHKHWIAETFIQYDDDSILKPPT